MKHPALTSFVHRDAALMNGYVRPIGAALGAEKSPANVPNHESLVGWWEYSDEDFELAAVYREEIAWRKAHPAPWWVTR